MCVCGGGGVRWDQQQQQMPCEQRGAGRRRKPIEIKACMLVLTAAAVCHRGAPLSDMSFAVSLRYRPRSGGVVTVCRINERVSGLASG
jgi:hypothetical protein